MRDDVKFDYRHGVPDRIKARVLEGAKLLDDVCPGWYKTQPDVGQPIDIDALDMASPHACVLGHIFEAAYDDESDYWSSPYHYGVYKLGNFDEDDDTMDPVVDRWANRHGFADTYDLYNYSKLDRAWRFQIEKRRDRDARTS